MNPATQDPTRGPHTTLRFAKGSDLLAWYKQLAQDTEGLSVNGALIQGLEHFRACPCRSTTTDEGNHHDA